MLETMILFMGIVILIDLASLTTMWILMIKELKNRSAIVMCEQDEKDIEDALKKFNILKNEQDEIEIL